jgi:hypothetical protein
MAINISQFPTLPNMANSDLVFTVTSSQASQPQFQFIADLTYSGSATVLQRIKQQPNPSSFGVFDFGQIVGNYLDSDNTWKTAQFTTSSNVAKRFNFRFGEEYGTSTSSSVSVYNGITNATTGSPALSASNYIYIINGLVEPNDAVNWNWPSQSYFQPITASTGLVTGSNVQAQLALTYAPITKSIQRTEYETISLINGNFNGSSTIAQDIYAIVVDQYNSSNTLISSSFAINLVNNGGGPRVSGNEFWSDRYTFQTQNTQLLTMGVGPANLSDAGFPITTSCAYYTVKITPQDQADDPDTLKWFAFRRYNIEGPACGYDGVRFAWKNQFGVWDYYTFTLQSDSAFAIERNSYEQSFVDFSTTSKTVAYNRERRGSSQFYNDLDQVQTANSNWLTQDEADWLRELFFSTNVYQQVDGNFFPVVISSANVVEKTNPRTQKTFQYQIEFKPANQLRPRI